MIKGAEIQGYEQFHYKRLEVLAEINRPPYTMKPFSFEVFKKTDDEKGKLLTAKARWDKSSLLGQIIFLTAI